MTREEKEKRYDEVINKLKHLMEQDIYPLITMANVQDFFPELKESEDDRIRNKLIEAVTSIKKGESPWFVSDKETCDKVLDWLEKQGEKDKLIRELGEYKVKYIQETLGKAFTMNNKDDERVRKTTIAFLKDFADKGYENAVECITWLENVGKDKEINNFNVIPGFYKCVRRMFDGTPDGKLLFEVGNIYECLSKHSRAEFEVSYGHSVYLEDPVVCKHFIPFERKYEPKFKVGDWSVSNLDKKTRQISEVHFDEYNSYYVVNGKDVNLEEYDRLHHLWTIQDAKDGDVLVNKDGAIFINAGSSGGGTLDYYCYLSVQNEFCIKKHKTSSWFYKNEIKPATKEQCNLLFQRMKEAECKWDAEKKELIKEKLR